MENISVAVYHIFRIQNLKILKIKRMSFSRYRTILTLSTFYLIFIFDIWYDTNLDIFILSEGCAAKCFFLIFLCFLQTFFKRKHNDDIVSTRHCKIRPVLSTHSLINISNQSIIFGGAASLHIGLPVRLPACPPVPVSFWRGFVDNTNIYHCWGVS